MTNVVLSRVIVFANFVTKVYDIFCSWVADGKVRCPRVC